MQKPAQTAVSTGVAEPLDGALGERAGAGMASGNNILNAVLFQVNWFACVIGGMTDRLWIPALILSLMLVLSARHTSRRHDMYLLITAAVVGLVLDSVWVQLGILDFGSEGLAPVWIVMMWMGVALTVNHSLGWLQKYPLLGGLLAGVAAPLCYLGGESLGAVQVDMSGMPLISVSWLLLFSACFWWGRQWGPRRAVAEIGH